MKNRFGHDIRKGSLVACTHPRGGIVTGKVAKLETKGDFVLAYGPRAILCCGMSFALDDCMPLQSYVSRLEIERASYRPFSAIAWTGGFGPVRPSETPKWERAYARALFREQVNKWRAYWKDSPDWDTLRIYFRRARMDSFASFRSALNR